MSVEEKVLTSNLFNLQYLQQGFPEELPHWDLCEDVLDGLDQFLESSEILLNARDAAGADPEHAALNTCSESQGRAQEPVKRAWTSQSGPARVRKQTQNRHAQQRFRQRQKVSASARSLPRPHLQRKSGQFIGVLRSTCPCQEWIKLAVHHFTIYVLRNRRIPSKV